MSHIIYHLLEMDFDLSRAGQNWPAFSPPFPKDKFLTEGKIPSKETVVRFVDFLSGQINAK